MIGSLLYLCASRPDIVLAVGVCARYQAAPKESHDMAVKRIFRYLAYTPTFGLWYPKDAHFSLCGYTDSDWAGDKDDRKSTSEAEAEYVAAVSCCTQLLWMRQTLKEYRVDCDKVPLLCNESAIKIAYNLVQHSRTKHIEILHHFIRDHVARGDVDLSYVGTRDQLADIFTKPLEEGRFCFLRNELNIIDSRSLA